MSDTALGLPLERANGSHALHIRIARFNLETDYKHGANIYMEDAAVWFNFHSNHLYQMCIGEMEFTREQVAQMVGADALAKAEADCAENPENQIDETASYMGHYA